MKNSHSNFENPNQSDSVTKTGGFYQENASKSIAIDIPKFSMPKGGGAIKGIDEKFEVNKSNGTATYSISIPFPENRNKFTPKHSLAYNSGGGNGPFGLGWSLGIPTIQRKTDKKLPEYKDLLFFDSNEKLELLQQEDVCFFSGSDDLLPLVNNDGKILLDKEVDGFYIRTYTSRIEKDFSRIERIYDSKTKNLYWRVTTKENITTYFGIDSKSRISNPKNEYQIFSWLPSFSTDNKGSIIEYSYKEDKVLNIDHSELEYYFGSERQNFINIYLAKISYCNVRAAYISNPWAGTYNSPGGFHFVVNLNYTDDRLDPFSSYRSGFEIRTRLICNSINIEHKFNDFQGITKSLQFKYKLPETDENYPQNKLFFLTQIKETGFDKNGKEQLLPPIAFEYQDLKWSDKIEILNNVSTLNIPVGLSENYQFVDLHREGISGILYENEQSFYYKSNIGNYKIRENIFEGVKLEATKPNYVGITEGITRLDDLENNGEIQLVAEHGFFQKEIDGDWINYTAFKNYLNIDKVGSKVNYIDLTGDGKQDALYVNNGHLYWYESLGKKGFASARSLPFNENSQNAIAVLKSTSEQKVFIADMSGDGLSDIVKIENGRVSYWPNLGYGRFGYPIVMKNAPTFDIKEHFNTDYFLLGDISGSGCTDILYTGLNKFQAYINQSGNEWSEASKIEYPFSYEQPNKFSLIDLFGTGTSCLVWSSPFDYRQTSTFKYVDLMGSKKTHVLTKIDNGYGKTTAIVYKSSTYFYLKDKLAGTPWVTKLPFPVQVVAEINVVEKYSGANIVNSYSYHHGYYDNQEKEFRGFGRVEQIDCEKYTTSLEGDRQEDLNQDPVLTKTWYNTGCFIKSQGFLEHIKNEFWYNHTTEDIKSKILEVDKQNIHQHDLTGFELRESYRALKGTVIREEIFGLKTQSIKNTLININTHESREILNRAELADLIPYSVNTFTYNPCLVQAKSENTYPSFNTLTSQTLTYEYDRNAEDPRILQTLNLSYDEFGNLLEKMTIAYPRLMEEKYFKVDKNKSFPEENAKEFGRTTQLQLLATYEESSYTNDIVEPQTYQLRKLFETKTFEIAGLVYNKTLFGVDDLLENGAIGKPKLFTEINYTELPTKNEKQKRLIEHLKTKFYDKKLKVVLPDGRIEGQAIPFEQYQLAFTQDILDKVYSSNAATDNTNKLIVDSNLLKEAKYFREGGKYWIQSGELHYNSIFEIDENKHKSRFYLPLYYIDAFDAKTSIEYDKYFLFENKITQHLDNEDTDIIYGVKELTNTINYDYAALKPERFIDENNNRVFFEYTGLGFLKAIKKPFAKYDEAEKAIEVTSVEYNFPNDEPIKILSKNREQLNESSRKIEQVEYMDGFGNVQLKITPFNNVTDQWVCSERLVMNNKAKPVIKYEPYRVKNTNWHKEIPNENKEIKTTIIYDAIGREERIYLPDGTFTKTIQTPWRTEKYDANDTMEESEWYQNNKNTTDKKLQKAIQKTLVHSNTPQLIFMDTLGRPFMQVDHNKLIQKKNDQEKLLDEKFYTYAHLNIEGNVLHITDARGLNTMGWQYDMLGHRIMSYSVDGGKRWWLNDSKGNSIRKWDQRRHLFAFEYDQLRRPTKKNVEGGDGQYLLDNCYERLIYGEEDFEPMISFDLEDLQNRNLLGKVKILYDTAGKLKHDKYDRNGNLTRSIRQMTDNYKTTINWDFKNPDLLLQEKKYEHKIRYDELQRKIRETLPNNSATEYKYNLMGLLSSTIFEEKGNRVEVVKNVQYNEKAQRLRIEHGNGVFCKYEYDTESFRLKNLTTRQKSNVAIQDLNYTYDPQGNILHIEDKARSTVFFNNEKVTTEKVYTYDSLYRLIEAQGAELDYLSDNATSDFFTSGKANPSTNVLRNYTQQYQYDALGNILEMKHLANGASWTRRNTYYDTNNRIKTTQIGNGKPHVFDYQVPAIGTEIPAADHHGFITDQPHLSRMTWSFKEEIISTAKQVVNDGLPETTYYVYDANGIRIRKITENRNGDVKDQWLYLGNYEWYNKGNLEIESNNIVDDQKRVAIFEEIIKDSFWKPAPRAERRIWRYQIADHIGNSNYELSNTGDIISQEEYHPFGTTSFSNKTKTEKALHKRYHLHGKERDEETGMQYHEARYYMPWLGRWCSVDPLAMKRVNFNSYNFCSNSPLLRTDSRGKIDEKPTANIELQKSKEYMNITVGNVMQQKEWMDYNKRIPQKIYINEKYYFDLNMSVECADYARRQVEIGSENKYTASRATERIDMYVKKEEDRSKLNFEYGIKTITENLKVGRGVMVGINFKETDTGNVNKATNHYVTIVGMGTDKMGEYFSYYDNYTGNSGIKIGTDLTNNRFHFAEINGNPILVDKDGNVPREGNKSKSELQYIVTEVRTNIEKKEPDNVIDSLKNFKNAFSWKNWNW